MKQLAESKQSCAVNRLGLIFTRRSTSVTGISSPKISRRVGSAVVAFFYARHLWRSGGRLRPAVFLEDGTANPPGRHQSVFFEAVIRTQGDAHV